MALSVIFDGLELNNPGRKYLISDGPDYGSQAVADALLTGEYWWMGEFDQMAMEQGLRRIVTLPLRINSASQAALSADQQPLLSRLAGASIVSPKILTVRPNGSNAVSTFHVFGGSWAPSYTQVSESQDILFGTLTLVCDWPVWGVAENLGSAGAPLVSNTVSPVSVTLTPTVVGDVPNDIILFVKNRDATKNGRSLLVSSISENATWTPLSDSSGWTVGTDGARDTSDPTTINSDMIKKTGTFTANQVYPVASWVTPTLPSDRRFTTRLRVKDASTSTRGVIQFRLRHVSGATEIVGAWRNVPELATSTTWQAVRMGAWTYPVGQVSSVGASSTTTFLEARSLSDLATAPGVLFDYAFYTPSDSTVTFATVDTGKVLVAAGATVRVESDQVFSTAGDTVASVEVGSHVRARGVSRFVVHLSEGFMAALDSAISYNHLAVDVYATVTPRFIHLAV